MSTDSTTASSVWERLGDAFTSFGEGVSRFLTRLFGSSNERVVRSLGYLRDRRAAAHAVVPGSLLAQINSHEETMKALSDADLQGLTAKYRERLAKGATLEELLPEAFAACREAARRTKNMRHYDVQMLGGVVLHRGNIAEMVTGEGKTLVATLPAFLNALEGKGVHVITVNDYLARRDCEWMTPIYKALGVSAGFIQSEMDPATRRKAYDCDITYGTNSEFGFDYLRDNMKPARWGDPHFDPYYQQCQKALNYAIIDEVDNILIDEARTPLIISGQAFTDVRRYAKANEIAVQLTDLEKKARAAQRAEQPAGLSAYAEGPDAALRPLPAKNPDDPTGVYFEIKEKEHTCHLTDQGVRKAEELAGVESFYTAGNMEWPHLIDNSLKAHHLYKKDKQYAVMRHPESNEMSIIIIDEFTGRLMIGRQWSDGLHQAVEAKHARDGVKIKEETQTLATVTLQNFFKLYKKLAGMTGTAMTEANEFWKIYHLDVIAIPTNKPLVRVNHADVIFRTEKEKWNAVVEEIERVNKWDILYLKDGSEVVGAIKTEHPTDYEVQLANSNQRQTVPKGQIKRMERKGRPMLIGTTDVDKSLKLSDLLKRRGVKHELLNALPEHAAREAEIVAQAGRIGSVTISTNMAGRGTDIILGGNPETMAWARLKDKYATRLDVPEDEWKHVVDDIEAKEKMKEQGRQVADMGGLHIIGTERHEARRIDNQLRGRAGRQGDPGSSRFYLALQDDLMRIFAGEWVSGLLERMGMTEGQAIESRMVSRQIEKAQKRVEERHFDSRKHLLDYDEVMDTQRKEVYGFRQKILNDFNPKLQLVQMLDKQINKAVDRFLNKSYGAASFAEFASTRLSLELEPGDFARCDYAEAERVAREKALRNVETQVIEAIEENLGDEDSKEWNWQALTNTVNKRWSLNVTDRDLKKVGKEALSEYLNDRGRKAILAVDLSDGAPFLDPDWGLRSVCDWARLKFQIKLSVAELSGKTEQGVKDLLRARMMDLYRQKDIEFPVTAAMARYMSEKPQGPTSVGQRYNREGLYYWARDRFPAAKDRLPEEEFRTQSRHRLHELLLEVSRSAYPARDEAAIDAQLNELFEGSTRPADPEDVKELGAWVKTEVGLEIPEGELAGKTHAEVQQVLWNAFDQRCRPEMRGMERGLLLNQIDSHWKEHLRGMDQLRSGVGLRGYGQEDPKIVYKQEGMKTFREMWNNIEDKVSETVFRMEETEAFQESLWAIQAAIHEAAPKVRPTDGQDGALSTNGASDKKQEPIRNRGEKVGRNDPCPCGSGKKYKNCHMRQTV
jgi:preprotein translocase subunit SecA